MSCLCFRNLYFNCARFVDWTVALLAFLSVKKILFRKECKVSNESLLTRNLVVAENSFTKTFKRLKLKLALRLVADKFRVRQS